MARVRAFSTAALVASLMAVTGCGSSDGEASTPAACLEGPEAFVDALGAAPDAATVDGVPIGDCLPEEQSAGQIATVGEAMIGAAADLNESARKQPLGEATVQLGYLVGAVEARAEATGGIHEDLALNVESAATYVPGGDLLPAGFQQGYDVGLSAGAGSG